ncbi:unnamed protein product [Echinostoma caproni]|uniref:Alpha-1,3-glucosyltransferase n=1 Tax=Echinostoma caproni TaxID=27848 RepID=A0A183B3D0_9TREM|nr:unnamed protein product [Echinostoma caproni]
MSLPVCLFLLFRPTKHRLLYALCSTSLTFFLFSYQVHEKSILLVTVPALCLIPISPFSSFLFSLSSTLSMWPLLLKDRLILPCAFVLFRSPRSTEPEKPSPTYPSRILWSLLSGYCLLFIAQTVWHPPVAYPDLFALLISTFSCVQFILFFLFWNYKVFTVQGV